MLNHITIMGRLTRDPELRRTGSGISVTNFSIACDRDYSGKNGGEKETDFIDCTAWRQTAEFVSKYFTKGRMAVVSGRLQTSNYVDKEGNKRRKVEVVADNVYFGDSKQSGTNSAQTSSGSYGGGYENTLDYAQSMQRDSGFDYPYPGSTAPASDYALLEDDDGQLPF